MVVTDANKLMESNFTFLQEHDPVFFQLANNAERSFFSDPNTTLIKLRQFGEAIAQDIATRCSIVFDQQTSQNDLLFKISREIQLDPNIRTLFHTLRIEGNTATHQFVTQHREALDGLKIARELAVWFHRSFGKQGDTFNPGAFIKIADPSQGLMELRAKVNTLKNALEEASERAEDNQQLAELEAKERAEAIKLAEMIDEEARHYKQQAEAQELQLLEQAHKFEERITELQAQLAKQAENKEQPDSQKLQKIVRNTYKASEKFSPDEELTRIIIDLQLNDAGWEADTELLRYSKGARPEKSKNKAIAEWPTTGKQKADYVLFAGLTPIAVVEAKRENTNVAGKIPQAERYAKGFTLTASMISAWEIEKRTVAWPDEADGHYHIPFVYSCNGRPYIKQLAEQSGTWFRDVRDPSNTAQALQLFHSPEGLLDRLKRSRENAEKILQQEGFSYLKLRDYQEKAIKNVESALEQNQKNCLLAMATGTGKTRTTIGLMYRFLKAERFKRILFLVDRNALGNQALSAFQEAPLEQNQSLSKIYNVNELGDMTVAAETRVQVATVQAMVKRVFQSDTPPNVDAFDCIIVDEAHRGYTLDQEMTEGELANRDVSQYLSSYRRVLDYFDAVKIGLTATPAKHTTEIFGKPVYTYSYREAVADDWLIDHEPPIRYETLLSKNGIVFEKGAKVNAVNIKTGNVETAELEDEQNFEIEAFNKTVITEGFNQVICKQLAQEIDPFSEEKTMIFCATDLHADMVKRLLDQEYKALYEDDYKEATVKKITGKSDQVDKLIRQYKKERYPNIAITVDLLTTGIDVPKICHLVFLRRIKSRILYEQMKGRATRRCDEIGKTFFTIYDPVDLYAALQDVDTMKPLVKNPNITIEQLVGELTDPQSLEQALDTPGEMEDSSHAHDVLDQLSQKIMRVMRKASNKAEKHPEIKNKLGELENLWGVTPEKLHQHLHQLGPQQSASFLQANANLLNQISEVKDLLGSEYMPLIYEGKDELLHRERSYGVHEQPADYLDSFNDFIRQQLNQSVALGVVVNRPKDLTREQLKEVKLLLDAAGYSEATLKTAWRNQTNQDIAASIVGYIRQAAIGEALIPFEQRVQQAMQHIYTLQKWTNLQRKWLDRLAKQLSHEAVVDEYFVNRAFARDGGSKRLNKVLDGELGNVLDQLSENIWTEAS